jgi:hypothetical protein
VPHRRRPRRLQPVVVASAGAHRRSDDAPVGGERAGVRGDRSLRRHRPGHDDGDDRQRSARRRVALRPRRRDPGREGARRRRLHRGPGPGRAPAHRRLGGDPVPRAGRGQGADRPRDQCRGRVDPPGARGLGRRSETLAAERRGDGRGDPHRRDRVRGRARPGRHARRGDARSRGERRPDPLPEGHVPQGRRDRRSTSLSRLRGGRPARLRARADPRRRRGDGRLLGWKRGDVTDARRRARPGAAGNGDRSPALRASRRDRQGPGLRTSPARRLGRRPRRLRSRDPSEGRERGGRRGDAFGGLRDRRAHAGSADRARRGLRPARSGARDPRGARAARGERLGASAGRGARDGVERAARGRARGEGAAARLPVAGAR